MNMKYRYLGHSCIELTINNTIILIDPFISGNDLASTIDQSSLQPDFILLTHGHQDHIADAEEIAKQSGATIISNYEIATFFGKKELETIGMNHGGTFTHSHFQAKYVNAVHSSSFPDGSYAGNPGGFVITTDSGCIYHAGDTALTYDMKLIGEEFSVDVACLPIGGMLTMDVSDAIKAAEFVNCKQVVGIHYDTMEMIAIDHDEALNKFRKAGLQLHLLNIGEEQTL